MKKREQFSVLVLLGVIGFVILVNMNALVALSLVALGVFAWYMFVRARNPQIITNSYSSMNSIDVGLVMSRLRRTGYVVVAAVIGVIVLVNMIVIIPAGYTGVYHLFGKVYEHELASGIHLINPLASVVRMSVRTEEYTMSVAPGEGQRLGDDAIEALTKEGLKVSLDITILYHLDQARASDVYRDLGIEYPEKVIRPEVRSAIREVIARYEAKDIYSEKREQAVGEIKQRLDAAVLQRGIVIESVLLRNLALPQMLTQAIESKLTAEQEAQRYDFVLQREEKEAERKRLEAAGQRDAQAIINESLSDRYLQYLYIQNLEKREGTIYVPYDLPLFRGL